MPYVKTINEDGTVSDIMAKALDPDALVNGFTQETAGEKALDAAAGKTLNDSLSTLDGAVVKKADLVNGFTQTEAGQNALDAAAGKTLNDSLANYATKTDLVPTAVPITRGTDTSVGTSTAINCYTIGKLTVFWGAIYLKNVSANSNVVCASGFPKPVSNFVTTSIGGYSVTNNMAVWVQSNDGTIRVRPHDAISSTEIEMYTSGVYIAS